AEAGCAPPRPVRRKIPADEPSRRCRMPEATSSLGVESFRSSVQGQVILPGDAGYDEARRVCTAHIARRPAVIARCFAVDDVRAALTFAREHGLEVAVKGGGHSLP